MKTVQSTKESTQISFNLHELLVLNAALNEVCNGIEIFEFSTRIGAERGEVLEMLSELRATIDKLEKES